MTNLLTTTAAASSSSSAMLTVLKATLVVVTSISFLSLLYLTIRSSADTTFLAPPSPSPFSILVGVLTFADRRELRCLHRLVRSLQQPAAGAAQVDVRFVFCRLTREDQRILVALEMMRYGDVMVLDCRENVNHGKTFAFLSAAAAGRRYDYVMKTDDDTYIRFPELLQALRPLPRKDLYFGHLAPENFYHEGEPQFMKGMGYVLSWDIVEWIARSNITENNTIGPEDKLVGRWLHDGGKGRNLYDTKPSDAQVEEWRRGGDRLIDEKTTQYDWPVSPFRFMPRTISVHRLKDNVRWARTLKYFNATDGLEPSVLHAFTIF